MKKPFIIFGIFLFSLNFIYSLQIQTKSSLENVVWTLEKTSGTMRIRNLINTCDGEEIFFFKALNYSGSMINVQYGDYLLFENLSNFGMLEQPGGVEWSDLQENQKDIFSVYFKETVGILLPLNDWMTFIPFVGYSYLKLDYTDKYTFLPASFKGHTMYHDVIFGLKEEFTIGSWCSLDFKQTFTPFSFYYPLHANSAFYREFGVESRMEWKYFALHIYISSRRTVEYGKKYDEYESVISDFGFTFRIGPRILEFEDLENL